MPSVCVCLKEDGLTHFCTVGVPHVCTPSLGFIVKTLRWVITTLEGKVHRWVFAHAESQQQGPIQICSREEIRQAEWRQGLGRLTANQHMRTTPSLRGSYPIFQLTTTTDGSDTCSLIFSTSPASVYFTLHFK